MEIAIVFKAIFHDPHISEEASHWECDDPQRIASELKSCIV